MVHYGLAFFDLSKMPIHGDTKLLRSLLTKQFIANCEEGG